jgi:DNA-binding XRE family transcriptional regulator
MVASRYVNSGYVKAVEPRAAVDAAFRPMATLRTRLGRAVRSLRKRAGYSQESFADRCHVHRTYMGSVERGETNISLDNIERIAKALGLTAGGLLLEAERER